MIWFILGITMGIYLGWKYKNIIDIVIQFVKSKFNL